MGNTRQMHTITLTAKGAPFPFQEQMRCKRQSNQGINEKSQTYSKPTSTGGQGEPIHTQLHTDPSPSCLAQVKQRSAPSLSSGLGSSQNRAQVEPGLLSSAGSGRIQGGSKSNFEVRYSRETLSSNGPSHSNLLKKTGEYELLPSDKVGNNTQILQNPAKAAPLTSNTSKRSKIEHYLMLCRGSKGHPRSRYQ